MPDITKIGLQERTIEQVSIAGEEALNERLGAIFAESPWTVTAESGENGGWIYYFRSKAGDTRPVTLIGSDKEPIIVRSGNVGGAGDVLIIPLAGNSWTKAEYDKENRMIVFEDHSKEGEVKCELPAYLAVSLKDKVDRQRINGPDYVPYSLDIQSRYEGEPYSPVSILVDVRCYEGPKEPQKNVNITIEPKASAFILRGQLTFDLSGSTDPSLYFKFFREKIAKDIHDSAFIAQELYIHQECGDRPPKKCKNDLYETLRDKKPQAVLGVTYYLGEERINIDIPFSLCEMTGCDGGYNISNAQPLLSSLIHTVEEKLEAPAGPDFPVEMPAGSEFGTRLFQVPYGQDVAGRLFPEVCHSTKYRQECLPATDRQKIVDWSLEKGLPLFLSVSLAPIEDLSPMDRATTVVAPFMGPTSSDDIYKRLIAICKDPERDRSASGSAAALLGAWAFKGDQRAKNILFELLFDASHIASEEAKTVVARTLALIITDGEAGAILNNIKAEPDAAINSIFLSSLAGHEEFLEAIKILLDSCHIELYENGKASGLVEAMGRVFIDPILQTGDLKLDLTPDGRKLLSGNNWPNDLLQRVHEEIVLSQEMSTYETAEALSPLIQLLQGYAFNSIPREMVERKELGVNTDLTKRHIYPGLGKADIVRQGVRLARTAGLEEAYLSIDGPRPVAIETGIFETEGTLSVPRLSQAEFDEFLLTAGVTIDDEWTITNWHIHPLDRTNRHRLTDNVPSGVDLLSYFYFAEEWLKKAPNAEFEFRILTPYGVLWLKPKSSFMDAVDKYELNYTEFVKEYESNMQYSGNMVTTPRLKEMLAPYFEVEFVGHPRESGDLERFPLSRE